MSAGKLKNLILLILLIANGFLLALVIPSCREAAIRQQQARTQLSELFARADVSFSADQIPEAVELYPMEALCTAEDLEPAAQALLGGGEAKAVSGGMEVTAERGVCRLSPGGRISAELREEAADEAARTAEILRQFGGRWTEPEPTAEGTYAVRQKIAGVPVLSHAVTFTYGGGLLTVEGRIVPEPKRTGAEACCTAEDALTSFLSSRLDLGWMGSRVESVVQGYLLTDGAAQGAVLLQPVWQIVTDAGVFRVDGILRTVTAE